MKLLEPWIIEEIERRKREKEEQEGKPLQIPESLPLSPLDEPPKDKDKKRWSGYY